jgi:CO/xanthine dehydrogenase FAD-binding subunit
VEFILIKGIRERGAAMAGNGMMSFEYERPTDWSEAARLLTEPGAIAKMGGCAVLTRFRSGRLRARLLVGLNKLPGVDELVFDTGGARIGAGVTLARLGRTPELAQGWPLLANVLSKIASPAIRTSATVVGNVAQGWSVGDLVPMFEICDAELDIRGPSGQRRISVSDYAKTPGTGALQPGEVISALLLKQMGRNVRMAYERFSLKQAFDLPLVSVAVGASIVSGNYNDVRVSVVGGSRMPARCAAVEEALNGKRGSENVIEAAAAAIAKWAEPQSDHRASAGYRRHLLGVLLRRALSTLAAA